MEHLSHRGRFNVVNTMSQLPKAMLEDKGGNTVPEEEFDAIDLSMAENWVIRQEVLQICKPAIETSFTGHVSLSSLPALQKY